MGLQILQVSDDEKSMDKIQFVLESKFDATVRTRKTLSEAIQIIEKEDSEASPTVDLLLYNYSAGKPSQFQSFWNALKGRSLPILIVCTEGEMEDAETVSSNCVGVVDRLNAVIQTTETLESLLKRGLLAKIKSERDYCRIKTKLLIELSPLELDIYIRLSEEKFLKLFQPGDAFEAKDLEKWKDHKNIDYLYVRAGETGSFLNKFTQSVERKAKSSQATIESTEHSHAVVHDTVSVLTQKLGFTVELQKLTRAQVQMNLNAIQNEPSLSNAFKRLKKTGGKIASHSLLLGYFAVLLGNRTKWASEQTSFKLSFAAFMHDIALQDQRLADFKTMKEFEAAQAEFPDQFEDPRSAMNLKLHPVRASEMIKGMKGAPPDVETLILQHHERPDGSGFPRGLKYPRIMPLSSIFIIAHELVDFAQAHGPEFDLGQFLTEMEQKGFYKGHFEEVLECCQFDS